MLLGPPSVKLAHYFVAEQSSKGIATRKIQGSDGEIKASCFPAVEVYPGKMLEWFKGFRSARIRTRDFCTSGPVS